MDAELILKISRANQHIAEAIAALSDYGLDGETDCIILAYRTAHATSDLFTNMNTTVGDERLIIDRLKDESAAIAVLPRFRGQLCWKVLCRTRAHMINSSFPEFSAIEPIWAEDGAQACERALAQIQADEDIAWIGYTLTDLTPILIDEADDDYETA